MAALDELAMRVITPYVGISVALALLAFFVLYSPLPEVETEDENFRDGKTEDKSKISGILKFPHLWLGALALFMYVGVEVVAGDTIIKYGMSLGIPIAKARMFTSFTLLAMVTGYLLIGILLIPKVITQRKALMLSAILGIVFTLAAIFTRGGTSVLFIALLGFANALIWPAIWPLAIHGLGKHIKMGSSILIMMIAGGALLPLLWGRLSDIFVTTPWNAYWMCIPCYLVILYYSLRGYKVGLKGV